MGKARIAALAAAALVLGACAAGDGGPAPGAGGGFGGGAAGSSSRTGGGSGGGGGGGGGTAAGTFSRTLVLGPSTSASTPFTTEPFGAREQVLVRAADVNGAGLVTSIAFRLDQASGAAVACPNVTIRLGHTSAGGLTEALDANYARRGSPTTVVNDETVTVPPGAAGDFVVIPLAAPFNYNGADDLVLEIRTTQGCLRPPPPFSRNPAGYPALARAASGSGSTAGPPEDALYRLKLGLTGGTAVVARPGIAVESAVPFTDAAGADQKVQLLYLAGEIDGRGPITGVALPAASATTAATYAVTVKLAHAAADALGPTFALNRADLPVTVADRADFHVPAGAPAGSYLWLPFAGGTFVYDGTRHLLVEVEVATASGHTPWRARPGGTAAVRLAGPAGAETGTPDGLAPDVRLRFAGGTMDVLTPAGASGGSADDHPFGTTEGRRQYLYLAAELGTRGTLGGIACRLRGDSQAGASEFYPAYEVRLAHATAATLSESFAGNLPDAVTVFSGAVEVPGGLREGDWIEIPFSVPFAYNGRDHLVVDLAGPAGTRTNLCILDTRSTPLYAMRRLHGDSQAALSGTLFTPGLLDLRVVFR